MMKTVETRKLPARTGQRENLFVPVLSLRAAEALPFGIGRLAQAAKAGRAAIVRV